MKQQMLNKKGIGGITLIALVITIIILLIIAGVSIATLFGENGILTQANKAKRDTEIAQEKEQIMLAWTGTILKNQVEDITTEDLNEQFAINGVNAEASGSNPIKIVFNDTKREYAIDSNGNITGPTEADLEDIEANEYGFYYGKPYVFNVPDSEYVEYSALTLYEDGSAQMVNSMEQDTMSITSSTNRRIDLSNGTYLEFSEDGKSLSMGGETSYIFSLNSEPQTEMND